jgi:FxLD family lantipeptide
MDTRTTLNQPADDADDFDLDISIVEADDEAINMLLGDTDNGCNTVKGSDC